MIYMSNEDCAYIKKCRTIFIMFGHDIYVQTYIVRRLVRHRIPSPRTNSTGGYITYSLWISWKSFFYRLCDELYKFLWGVLKFLDKKIGFPPDPLSFFLKRKMKILLSSDFRYPQSYPQNTKCNAYEEEMHKWNFVNSV